MRTAIFTAALALTALPACSTSGLGNAVREDIRTQMASAQDPIAACYHAALERDRNIAGMMTVSFVAEPKTGEFSKVTVARSDIADPELQACVTEAVGQLKLAKPQKSSVAVSYPIRLTPSN